MADAKGYWISNMYLSKEEVMFPIVMKTDKGYFVKREVAVSEINSEEVNFLGGKETIKEWKTKVDLEDDKMEFKEQEKNVDLTDLEGGHHLVKLELV